MLDLTTNPPTPRATVPIGGGTPNFTAIAPGGAKAYVSNPGNGTVVPLDLTRDPPVAGTPFSAGTGPEGIALTPDGSRAYGADLTGNAVIPVDVATDSPRATVRVRLPGSRRFVVLGPGGQLPVGTIVDARKGIVRITATSGGRVYSALLYEGQFRIVQRKRTGATTDLTLVGGDFKGCPRGVREARNKKKSIRHLWGDGNGNFRTVGRFSAAVVRGTKRLTDDQCGGTLTKVVSGSVAVRDFVKRRTVIVRAGKQYRTAARAR